MNSLSLHQVSVAQRTQAAESRPGSSCAGSICKPLAVRGTCRLDVLHGPPAARKQAHADGSSQHTFSSARASLPMRSRTLEASGPDQECASSNLVNSTSIWWPLKSLARSPSMAYTLFLTTSKVSTCSHPVMSPGRRGASVRRWHQGEPARRVTSMQLGWGC